MEPAMAKTRPAADTLAARGYGAALWDGEKSVLHAGRGHGPYRVSTAVGGGQYPRPKPGGLSGLVRSHGYCRIGSGIQTRVGSQTRIFSTSSTQQFLRRRWGRG